MQRSLIDKLKSELANGITTEVQVVYVMVMVRKLLETLESVEEYQNLKFHCDWVLHTELSRTFAQNILKQFDAANILLKQDITLNELPSELRRKIDGISKMSYFKEEFDMLLNENGITRVFNWAHFLYLYAKAIENCPLSIRSTDTVSTINKVTINVILAYKLSYGEQYYKIDWRITDKNGKNGTIFVISSFSVQDVTLEQV